MGTLNEINQWATTLPAWQSDAVRRLLTQASLSDADKASIFTMILGDHGALEEGTTAPTPQPLGNLFARPTSAPIRVRLKEVHSVQGVNALLPDQSVLFNLDGLTVIYGENGTGKSGYARILKHACHAREKSNPILHNIATVGVQPHPQATLELDVDGHTYSVAWTHASHPDPHLLQISVFDSHCARVFLDEANEVVYIPFGLDVFARLGTLLKDFKERLDARIALLPASPPLLTTFQHATAVGKFVSSLSAEVTDQALDAHAAFSPQQVQRHSDLERLLGEAKLQSTKAKAESFRLFKKRIDKVILAVTSIEAGFSSAKIEELKTLAEHARTTAQAAKLAAAVSFGSDSLPGTGDDAWRELYLAAQRFSQESSYPDCLFPNLAPDALCVLCQQSLLEEARTRFKRFEAFVTDETAKRSDLATGKLSTATQQWKVVSVSTLADDSTFVETLNAFDPSLATETKAFFDEATTLKTQVIAACKSNTWVATNKPANSPSTALLKLSQRLEALAIEHEQTDKPEEHQRLTMEFNELRDRKLLFDNVEQIKEHIRNLRLAEALRKCLKAVDTTNMTRFGGELVDHAITEALKTALETELRSFAVECLPLRLKKTGERGKTKYKLECGPSDARSPDPSHVLSEGEQSVVAIASFLAELTASASQASMVFDDPVSSLDHRYREKVATRLVEEGKKRQVIVFTHDIVFLLALESACAAHGVSFLTQTLRRTRDGSGQANPLEAQPWHGSKVKTRLGHLRTELGRITKIEGSDRACYSTEAKDWLEKLRETWERVIEEVLFNDAVQRFRPSVKPRRLREVQVEASDYVTINHAYGWCSNFLHDKAAASDVGMPTSTELEGQLKALENYVTVLKNRGKEATKITATLTKPPVARLAPRKAPQRPLSAEIS